MKIRLLQDLNVSESYKMLKGRILQVTGVKRRKGNATQTINATGKRGEA